MNDKDIEKRILEGSDDDTSISRVSKKISNHFSWFYWMTIIVLNIFILTAIAYSFFNSNTKLKSIELQLKDINEFTIKQENEKRKLNLKDVFLLPNLPHHNTNRVYKDGKEPDPCPKQPVNSANFIINTSFTSPNYVYQPTNTFTLKLINVFDEKKNRLKVPFKCECCRSDEIISVPSKIDNRKPDDIQVKTDGTYLITLQMAVTNTFMVAIELMKNDEDVITKCVEMDIKLQHSMACTIAKIVKLKANDTIAIFARNELEILTSYKQTSMQIYLF
jgi:hypothetical protein